MSVDTNAKETRGFQAEVKQLLQLMIHSMYSNKEIFLRELISNASDACDRLRFESIAKPELLGGDSDFAIDVGFDKAARTIMVSDNGIGMSREEAITQLGTIAKSGTREFFASLTGDQKKDAQLIGQFGVGFYSSFMVADKVTLVTRHAGTAEGVRWESDGEGTYTIQEIEDAPQGTAVTLHLKPVDTEDQLHDYTSKAKLREVVKHYSDFITWPIRMAVEGTGPDSEPLSAVETLNSMKALWARARDEVSDDEYHEFYKHVSHDWQDPLEVIQLKAEGTFEYEALLFIPSHAPFDLFTPGGQRGVQLYVKRVFLMDNCPALLPGYLRFVTGVVDARDLSLNVSRELLQQDRQIQLMRRRLVRKVLSTMRDLLARDAERYRTLWTEFGAVVKEGLVDDHDNRDAILEICSFPSTHDAEAPTTLRDYLVRMPEGQH